MQMENKTMDCTSNNATAAIIVEGHYSWTIE